MEEVIEHREEATLEEMAERVLHTYMARLVMVLGSSQRGASEVKGYLELYDDVLCLVQGVRDLQDEGYESDCDCDDEDDDDDEL